MTFWRIKRKYFPSKYVPINCEIFVLEYVSDNKIIPMHSESTIKSEKTSVTLWQLKALLHTSNLIYLWAKKILMYLSAAFHLCLLLCDWNRFNWRPSCSGFIPAMTSIKMFDIVTHEHSVVITIFFPPA